MDEPLHPSTLSEILDRTAQIYRARFMVFFGIAVIPTAVLLVFAGMVALLMSSLGPWGMASTVFARMIAILLLGVVFLVALPTFIGVTALATAAMNHAAARAFMGQAITIRASYLAVWRKGWRFVGLYLFEVVVVWVVPFAAWSVLLLFSTVLAALIPGAAAGALFALGVLLIIAVLVGYGFWMAIRVSLAFPASVVEQAGAWDALGRSATLTKGSRGRILVLYLLGMTLNFILSMAIALPLILILALLPGVNSPQRAQAMSFVVIQVMYAAGFAVQALTRPVYGIALMLFYYDQRIRQEAFDIEWMMMRAGLVAPPPPQFEEPTSVAAAPPITAPQQVEQETPTASVENSTASTIDPAPGPIPPLHPGEGTFPQTDHKFVTQKEHMRAMKWRIPIFLCCFLLAAQASAQSPAAAPPLLPPDDRYKADLLLIVAHPDDDVMVGGYLARLALDQHKRVAVIYTTMGDGGGNSVGNEAGAALGQVRVLEARRALGSLGIENVWFLGHHDTPGQNPLRSLDSWNHGLALDEIVRLVRLTRPPVILTWLPRSVAGENHGDHQAAGILATEAFDAAADPTFFPEQVSPPRDRTGMNNLTEGLLPWQPQKLYFFSDAFEVFSPYWHDPAALPSFRKSLVDGAGPSYDTTTVSPSHHVSYAQLEAEQQTFYRTQEGALGDRAIASKDFKDFEFPIHLILGKSIVLASTAGDVFEGVSESPVSFARVQGFGFHPDPPDTLRFRIGDPWSFYTQFWSAHDLHQLLEAMPKPELGAGFGNKLNIAIEACNYRSDPVEFAVTSALPAGWTDRTPFARYPVRPGECYPFLAQVSAPASGVEGWQQLTWTATVGPRRMTAELRVYLSGSEGLPQ